MKALMRTGGAVAALTLALLAALPVFGAPLRQDNLLANPDFEGNTYNFSGNASQKVPEGWEPWWQSPKDECFNSTPNYNPSTASNRVQSGLRSASLWTQGPSYGFSYNAGLLQAVDGISAGSTYRFTIYGHAWSTPDIAVGTSSGSVQMQIGINPNGGKDPFDSAIVWSNAVSAIDVWQQFSVEAKANGSQITVFVRSRPDFCYRQNDTYWDNASLTLVSGPSAAQPTSAPAQRPAASSPNVPVGSIPIAQPDATGKVVHRVNAGETLIGVVVSYDNAYGPGKVTLESVRQLNNLTSDVLRVGQELIIIDAPPPTPTPEPTPTPAPTPTPEGGTPVAEALPVDPDAAAPGTICVSAYDDQNANSLPEPGESLVAGITFALGDGSSAISTYTTDGASEPYCFAELLPGEYVVSWTGDAYEPTSEQTWSTVVASGATVTRQFGMRTAEQAAAEAEAEAATNSAGGFPTWAMALLGALGVVLLLSGLGAAGYFYMKNRVEAEE